MSCLKGGGTWLCKKWKKRFPWFFINFWPINRFFKFFKYFFSVNKGFANILIPKFWKLNKNWVLENVFKKICIFSAVCKIVNNFVTNKVRMFFWCSFYSFWNKSLALGNAKFSYLASIFKKIRLRVLRIFEKMWNFH